EVLDRGHLRARHLPLKRRVRSLDLSDERGDVVARVVGAGLFGHDAAFALGIEARDEANAIEEILRGIGGEVKDAVLLAYLRGEHGDGSTGWRQWVGWQWWAVGWRWAGGGGRWAGCGLGVVGRGLAVVGRGLLGAASGG